MSNIRRIKLPNLYNFRDLGGYETKEGGVTVWNRLYRCDCPSDLKEEEWQRLRELGIKTLIDIRSSYEAAAAPVKAPEDFHYLPYPLFREEAGADLSEEAGRKFMESLSLDYREIAANAPERIAGILQRILESLREGNVAFFCTAGKDRTGIISAEILRLSGVSDEDIVANYAITEIYNEQVIRARLASIPEEIMSQVSPETMEKAVGSKPQAMWEYLEWSGKTDFPKLLEQNGFTPEMRQELKEMMVVS